MALEGADILITIAEFPKPRSDIWSALAKARAIENQIPHVACNRTGSDPRKDYFGGSLIINAEGDILAEASDNETILIADIDTEQKTKYVVPYQCLRIEDPNCIKTSADLPTAGYTDELLLS